MLIDFFNEHILACIVLILAIAVLIFILTVTIIKAVKRNNQIKLEKMLSEIPVIPDEEVAVTEIVHENRREGKAELIWVREQSFATENAQAEVEEIVKEEKKAVKAASKAESKSTTKTKTSEKSKKTTTKSTTAKTTSKQTKKPSGKWVIREKGEGEFIAFFLYLLASFHNLHFK